jgi:hypothetical protein
MDSSKNDLLSRRGFCLCCVGGAAFTATAGWLTPRQAFAEARGLVSLIKDSAAVSPIVTHKLRNSISAFEGSGGNIAVLTGSDGKVLIDAGIGVSRLKSPKLLRPSAPIPSPISSIRTGTSTMPTAMNGCIRPAQRSSPRRTRASIYPRFNLSRTGIIISFRYQLAEFPAKFLQASTV